jgi:hypothetical protein
MISRRSLALWLMEHSAAVMPPERRGWSEAMRAEFACMPNDREALTWAVGCLWASYRERMQPMNVFVNSLRRAAAVSAAVSLFYAVLLLLDPVSLSQQELRKLLRLLTEFYGGIFATLWICELLIARFWASPDELFKKTLARTIALWLWPMGFEVYCLIRALLDPVIRGYIDATPWPFVRQTVIDFFGHGGGTFAGIFVSLLLCELAITRFWRAKAVA